MKRLTCDFVFSPVRIIKFYSYVGFPEENFLLYCIFCHLKFSCCGVGSSLDWNSVMFRFHVFVIEYFLLFRFMFLLLKSPFVPRLTQFVTQFLQHSFCTYFFELPKLSELKEFHEHKQGIRQKPRMIENLGQPNESVKVMFESGFAGVFNICERMA